MGLCNALVHDDAFFYIHRAKFIQNKPRVNEDPKDALIREFQDEIEQLKAKLAAKQRAKTAGAGIEGLAALREQIRKELEAGLRSGASADALQHVRCRVMRIVCTSCHRRGQTSSRLLGTSWWLLQEGLHTSPGRSRTRCGCPTRSAMICDHSSLLQIDAQTAELARYAARLEEEQRERMALEQRIKDMKAWVHDG